MGKPVDDIMRMVAEIAEGVVGQPMSKVVKCMACGQKNRVPTWKKTEAAKCGRCKGRLVP